MADKAENVAKGTKLAWVGKGTLFHPDTRTDVARGEMAEFSPEAMERSGVQGLVKQGLLIPADKLDAWKKAEADRLLAEATRTPPPLRESQPGDRKASLEESVAVEIPAGPRAK
jgi:hypothetical protein